MVVLETWSEKQRQEAVACLRLELAKREYNRYVEYVYRGAWKEARHHKAIGSMMERVLRGELKRLMLWLPPQHGKSMQVTETLPSYFIGKNPEKRAMVLSYSEEFATRFGRANRQKIQEYGSNFGVSLSKSNASATNWEIANHRGGLVSASFGGSVTGQGADLLIIDDPVKNREEAESKTMRDKVFAEYQSTALTRLSASAPIIIIQTRWHEDDLSGRILSQEGGGEWTVLSIPLLAEQNDVLARREGEALWPESGRDEAWAIKTKRDVGSYVFASLYQQRPSPSGGGIFQKHWFRRFDPMHPPVCVAISMSVDCAFKNYEDSDYVAIHCWGKRGPDAYLLDRVHAKLNFPETVKAIQEMARRLSPNSIYIEDKANGTAVISILRSEIPGIIPVEPRGGKVARANSISGMAEAGNIFIPSGLAGDEVIEEAAAFPNALHDDDVDAMTQALNRMYFQFSQVPGETKMVKWEKDQWEDYYNASEDGRKRLIGIWGEPLGI